MSYYVRSDGVIYKYTHCSFDDFESFKLYLNACKLRLTDGNFPYILSREAHLDQPSIDRVLKDLGDTLEVLMELKTVDETISYIVEILLYLNKLTWRCSMPLEALSTAIQTDSEKQ